MLERAYESANANPESTITGDILNYLENVYYNLRDEFTPALASAPTSASAMNNATFFITVLNNRL